MKKCLFFVAVFLIAAAGLSAQTVSPAPTATPTGDDDVVKISTNLIQIDVSVTDKKGKPIADLKPEEIEIYENGKKQKVTNFSFVSNLNTTETKADVTDKNTMPIPQAALRNEQIRRTFALVVDDLSLSFESAYQTRRALKKFVDEQMQPGDLVAIIRTGAGMGALQQFTSDKRILYAAIEKVKWNPLGNGGISAFAPIEAAPDTSLQSSGGQAETDEPSTGGVGESLDDFRSSVFATGTLGALKYIVQGMGQLPGRKSVILFSDGFKLFETDSSGFQESGRVLDFVKQLIDTANRASVVFYTIDPRGLQYTGMTAADAPSDVSPEAMNKAMSDRRDQLLDTQEGLNFLAKETGGIAIQNNNDLIGGVRRVLEDQSYYLVAYEPDTDTFDPAKRKFNKLDVKVLRTGATVRYRSGFFNIAERVPEKSAAAVLSPTQQLENALVSPFAVSDIGLRLNALFASSAANPMFVRSLLHIDAGGLTAVGGPDGTKKIVFDVLAMSFGDNGQIVDQLAKTYTLTLSDRSYAKVKADGFVYHFVFPVKKAGAYQYRVAIRDVRSGNLGSASQFIEVPNIKKNRLELSSIVLENLTAADWQKLSDPKSGGVRTNPMGDTATRRIKSGSVLRFGYEIYGAKLDGAKNPNLQTRIRIFSNGKLVLDGRPKTPDLTGQTDLKHIKAAGAVAIGEKLPPGDYILQVIATDGLAGSKNRTATQFVQFEIVE